MDVKINIPDNVKYILNTLQEHNYEAYIVGGCVRDSMLNRQPNDWDITTNAKPEEIINLFDKTIPTGIEHGTVTVIVNKEGYEITTYRIDGEYKDNRHPSKVEFVSDLKKDLARRDFTFNSMAYNDKSGLIDYFGGEEDLRNQFIRCVGNSYDRFEEDALRMLRAVRFSAQLGFSLSCNIEMAIKLLHYDLEEISIERIRSEFNKILLSDSSKVSKLIELGIIDYIIPEIRCMKNFNQNNPYHDLDLLNHSIKSMNIIENKLHLKLAMLLHDIGKINVRTTDKDGISHYYGHAKESILITEQILKRMKYDNDTINKVLTLIKYHDYTLKSRSSIKKMLNKIGQSLLRDLIRVQWSDILAQNPVYAKERLINLFSVEKILLDIIKEKECFSIKDLAVNGKDLIELGYRQGKEIGYILNQLLQMVIENNSINEREKLIKIIKEKML